jgi:glycerol-3-phosphate dehydrogenase (NAD(P)+)
MNNVEITNVAVIGGGSWGTALANLLAEKGLDVDLWVRETDVRRQIREERVNGLFLPGVRLNARLNPVGTFEEALSGKELALLAMPSHVFREVLTRMKPSLAPGVDLIAATKGIENETLMIMSQVVESVLPEQFSRRFACLAGPSFAVEVAKRYPTAVTIGCGDQDHAERLQRLFSQESFRVYVSHDLIGVQLGGALKNVIAIAAGASDGLGFGHNARAALITRGLAEITRLGVAMGATPLTFAGLAGMGDLVLTCTGDLSRNRSVGLQIGKGKRLDEITAGMSMVAEGIKTSRSAYALSRKVGVDMPIIQQVYAILWEEKDPRAAVRDLMTRELRVELEH